MLVAFAAKQTLGVIIAGGQMVNIISTSVTSLAGQLMTGVAHTLAIMTVTWPKGGKVGECESRRATDIACGAG